MVGLCLAIVVLQIYEICMMFKIVNTIYIVGHLFQIM